MKLKTITASIAALGLAATAAQAVQAAEPLASPAAAAPASAEAQSRRAVRDKETGKLRAPTDDELQAMEAADRAARKAKGLPEEGGPGAPLKVRQYPGGMRGAVLGTDYMVTLTGKRRADGSVQQTHVEPGHEHPVARDTRPTE